MRIGSSNKFRWRWNKSQLLEILKHFDSANKTMSGWQQKQCCPIVIGLSAMLESIRTCKREREGLKRLSLVFDPDWKHGQTVQASLSTGPAQLLTPCWLRRGRFANLPLSYVRDGRVGLALSPHVAEQFKSWNLIASLEKLPLLLRCYGSRWVLCQFLCLTHKSQYQRSTHTWDAFYLLLPATHLLWEIRGKIILNKFDEKLKT